MQSAVGVRRGSRAEEKDLVRIATQIGDYG